MWRDYLHAWLGLKLDRRAVTAIEYALIAALIAVVIIGAVTTLGKGVSKHVQQSRERALTAPSPASQTGRAGSATFLTALKHASTSHGLKKGVTIPVMKAYIQNMAQTTNLGLLQTSPGPVVDELGLTPSQKAALLQSVERGEVQYLAGGAISGKDVLAWIRSWGSDHELSATRPRADRT
jgi:Flp pilus assembly pilin Flp